MVYRVDYWDAFDGWTMKGFPVGFDKSAEFESKEQAITRCKQLQLKSPPNSMHEHYGVIDLDIGSEIFCGRTWYNWEFNKNQLD